MTTYRGEDRRRRKEDRDSEAELHQVREGVDQLMEMINANTELCQATHTKIDEAKRVAAATASKLDAHIAVSAPVIAAWSTVQRGVKVMDTLGRAGDWLLSKWKPILIIGVAVKVVMSGGSLSEAWATLKRIFKAVE